MEEIKKKLDDFSIAPNVSEEQGQKSDTSRTSQGSSASVNLPLEGNTRIKRVLDEVFLEFAMSSLDRLKWSVNISIQWICSHLQDAEIYRVIDLMHKSSGDILEMMIKTLNVPRCDLLHQLQYFDPKLELHTWKFVLEVLRKLNCVEYKKFISRLEEELSHIWKQRLDEADLSQVIELMETLFSQDPAVLTVALEEMASLTQTEDLSALKASMKADSTALSKLSPADFVKLIPYLRTFLPHLSEVELEEGGILNINDLMETNSFRNCVQMAEKVLKRMERLDLVNKLQHHNSGIKILPGLLMCYDYKWFLRWSNSLNLLLETLENLPAASQQSFQRTLAELSNLKGRASSENMDPLELVFWIVLQYGRQSVFKVADVLIKMGLRREAQRMLYIHSNPPKQSFLMETMSELWLEMAYILAEREMLLDTVHHLSYNELSHFEWFVQFTCLQWGFSWLHLEWERKKQEFQIMETECCPLTAKEECAALMSAVVVKHSSEMMIEVFMNMDRDDLAEYVRYTCHHLDISKGFNSEFVILPELHRKVQPMVIVIERLMEVFGHLSMKELNELKRLMTSEAFLGAGTTWSRLCHYEASHLVFFVIETCGPRSVDLTKSLLDSIGRQDLKQMLDSKSSVSFSGQFQDPLLKRLIQNVATVAAVNDQFGQTLSLLSGEDLKHFKKLFLLKTIFHSSSHLAMAPLATAKAEETGTLLLHAFGFVAVNLAYEVLLDMKRIDLAQNLRVIRDFQTRNRPKLKVATEKHLREDLFKMLSGLSHTEIDRFKLNLQLKLCKMDPVWVLEKTADTDAMIDLILETSGQCSMEVITDVLRKMGREDLIILRLKGGTGTYTQLQRTWIQAVLKELTDSKETQVFRKHLQTSCESNLSRRFVQNYLRLFPSLPDLVDLLVAIYGESASSDIIRTALTAMGRHDLVKIMSSRAFKAWMELDSVTSATVTSAMGIWTKLDPEVEETKKHLTYRLQSDAGHYECSVSGLRWSCKERVTFLYNFGSWEEHMERIKAMQYMPAGPLIDISVKCGRLEEVYLPHWICIDTLDTEDKMAVLHIGDCGDVVEEVTVATTTHVKLIEPKFSPRAVLIKLGFNVKVYCSLLIYKTNTAFLTLHVYLIPRDPGLKESMDRTEQQHGYSIIRKPHPDKSLKMRDQFVIKANLDTVYITPQKLTLRYQSPPNFFEVYTRNPDFDFELYLTKENESASVWSCTIRQDDYTERAPVVPRPRGVHFIDYFEEELIKRVSNVPEILDHLKRSGVIRPEAYDTIRRLPTSQQQMRELFRGPLRSSGDPGKDIFYTILKDKEQYLCKDLEKLYMLTQVRADR